MYLFRTIVLLLVRLPLALVGVVMNLGSYIVAYLSGVIGEGTDEDRSTRRIMAGVFASVVTWVGWSIAAGVKWNAVWAWVFLALGPIGAMTALHFLEKRRQLFDEARAYLRLRSRANIREELSARRDEVYRQVAELANLYMDVGRTPADPN